MVPVKCPNTNCGFVDLVSGQDTQRLHADHVCPKCGARGSHLTAAEIKLRKPE
jgi:predicted RNA-binding Zn-ribbon protein involved in translation (DUF1610 family)